VSGRNADVRLASSRLPAKRRYGRDLRDIERLKELNDAVGQSISQYLAETIHRLEHDAEIVQQRSREFQQIGDLLDETFDRIEATCIVEHDLLASQLQRFYATHCNATAACEKVERVLRALPPMLTPADMWEQSGHTDLGTLRFMLAAYKATLPPTLFDGLNEILEGLQRRRPADHRHVLRWGLVFEGRHIKRLTWKKAYAYASRRLAGTSAGGGLESVCKSYKRVSRVIRRRRGKTHPT
jgi:hypothetical protein